MPSTIISALHKALALESKASTQLIAILLDACETALVAQELRTRKVMEHIAAEHMPTKPPPLEHTLLEEEIAERKLKTAIAKAKRHLV